MFDKKKLEKQNLFVVLFLIKNPDADDDNDGINDVIGCMSMCECNITKTQYTFFLDKISSIAWMDGGGKRQTKTIRQNNINLRKGLFSTHYLFEYVFLFYFVKLSSRFFVCLFLLSPTTDDPGTQDENKH